MYSSISTPSKSRMKDDIIVLHAGDVKKAWLKVADRPFAWLYLGQDIERREIPMYQEYTHSELQKEVQSISGEYILDREEILTHERREVLYILGRATIDSSCCGVGGCGYAIVPGYVRKLKIRRNPDGLWVSEVEPILDEKSRHDIENLLKERELVQQVQFL